MPDYGGVYLESDDLIKIGICSVGKNVRIHNSCVLIGLENIVIGSNVRIDAFCILTAALGYIRIGSHIHIGSNTFCSGAEGIEMHDFCGLSGGVKIYTCSDDYSGMFLTNPTIPDKYINLKKGPVLLGRHVIIGANTVILPQTHIGMGSAVGALSLVKENLPEWGIYGGVPTKRLGERRRDLLEMESRFIEQEIDTHES